MEDALEALEREMARLRRAMRMARTDGDRQRVESLRADLHATQSAWDALVVPDSRGTMSGQSSTSRRRGLRPLREQVLDALTLIGVPAAPKMIRTVHQAFYGSDLPARRLTSLRRDEEASYTATRTARTYICPALTADRLTPARALLTLSTWPLQQRIVADTSARTDFLTLTIRLCAAAEPSGTRAESGSAGVEQLLQHLAPNIPGAAGLHAKPSALRAAAQAELATVSALDQAARAAAADRGQRLDLAHQLFGRPA
ncbi:hypothetical protein AB0H82_10620 [Streptomyces sp. NPDC050732]|uniref:hypothetical protein n=1 Tax=Streptomyces sp. NPDC050732 TaxID=3154632 RepID=UPI00343B97D1